MQTMTTTTTITKTPKKPRRPSPLLLLPTRRIPHPQAQPSPYELQHLSPLTPFRSPTTPIPHPLRLSHSPIPPIPPLSYWEPDTPLTSSSTTLSPSPAPSSPWTTKSATSSPPTSSTTSSTSSSPRSPRLPPPHTRFSKAPQPLRLILTPSSTPPKTLSSPLLPTPSTSSPPSSTYPPTPSSLYTTTIPTPASSVSTPLLVVKAALEAELSPRFLFPRPAPCIPSLAPLVPHPSRGRRRVESKTPPRTRKAVATLRASVLRVVHLARRPVGKARGKLEVERVGVPTSSSSSSSSRWKGRMGCRMPVSVSAWVRVGECHGDGVYTTQTKRKGKTRMVDGLVRGRGLGRLRSVCEGVLCGKGKRRTVNGKAGAMEEGEGKGVKAGTVVC